MKVIAFKIWNSFFLSWGIYFKQTNKLQFFNAESSLKNKLWNKLWNSPSSIRGPGPSHMNIRVCFKAYFFEVSDWTSVLDVNSQLFWSLFVQSQSPSLYFLAKLDLMKIKVLPLKYHKTIFQSLWPCRRSSCPRRRRRRTCAARTRPGTWGTASQQTTLKGRQLIKKLKNGAC